MHTLIRRIALATAATLVAAASACAPDPLPGEPNREAQLDQRQQRSNAEDEGVPVAAVDGRIITTSEFDIRLGLLSPAATQLYSPPPRRPTLLDLFVTLEIVANDATRRGLVDSPWEDVIVRDATARAWVTSLVIAETGLASIDDAAIEARWEERSEEYDTPEQRAFATIVIADRERAEELLQRMRAQIDDGYERANQVFGRFAFRHTIDDDTRADNGFAGRMVHPDDGGTANRDLADAVFALEEPGDIAGPIATARGWELVQLRTVFPARDINLDEARAVIRQELAWEREAEVMRAELDRMAGAVAIERDDELVARLAQARVGGDPEPLRPRRWELGGLVESNARIVGFEEAAALRSREHVLSNPLAAPGPAAQPAPPEGSADAAPTGTP